VESKAAATVLLNALPAARGHKEAFRLAGLLSEGAGPQCEEIVPLLVEALNQPREQFAQGGIVAALGKIGPGARAAVPALAEIASRKDSVNRLTAVEALGRIGPAAGAAVPALNTALREAEWPEARREVTAALWRVGESEVVLRALTRDIETDDEPTRREAVVTLTWIGAEARAALPILARALKDRAESVRAVPPRL
jgi:HEAT repeat protein